MGQISFFFFPFNIKESLIVIITLFNVVTSPSLLFFLFFYRYVHEIQIRKVLPIVNAVRKLCGEYVLVGEEVRTWERNLSFRQVQRNFRNDVRVSNWVTFLRSTLLVSGWTEIEVFSSDPERGRHRFRNRKKFFRLTGLTFHLFTSCVLGVHSFNDTTSFRKVSFNTINPYTVLHSIYPSENNYF